MAFVWADLDKLFHTAVGVELGLRPMIKAAPPETCGQAMDVPPMVVTAELDVCPADATAVPGAMMSTQLPQLLKPDRRSL